MHIRDMPYCCTADLLVGFGEHRDAEPDHQEVPEEHSKYVAQVRRYMRDSKKAGKAIIVAFTTDKQPNINAVLEELGWYATDWMSKQAHADNKLAMWWYPLEELDV